MPCETQEVVETYWTICWKWIFPYPCKKSRTVRKWCCTFSWVKESRWGFFCTLEGCADGQLYKWTAFCFGLFGSQVYYDIFRCFGSELTSSGPCPSTPPVTG
jgi:hypothetical protein